MTSIAFGLAVADFGRCTFSTPFFNSACIGALSLYVRTRMGSTEKPGAFERLQYGVTHSAFEIPQPLHLRLREMKARNLVVFRPNQFDPISHRVLESHVSGPGQVTSRGRSVTRSKMPWIFSPVAMGVLTTATPVPLGKVLRSELRRRSCCVSRDAVFDDQSKRGEFRAIFRKNPRRNAGSLASR